MKRQDLTPRVCGQCFFFCFFFLSFASAKSAIYFACFPTEKRAKYDNGEDPLDPEAQQGGGNPWQHGGFPFGEGFQFKFHFN